VVPRGDSLRELVAVCGHRYEHQLSFSDVASLIDCETCRAWIRVHEKDAHRMKLIENAWKGPAATEPFWNDSTKCWDI
jgi:hypothetical protein